MARVSDFVVIQSSKVKLGDNDLRLFSRKFNTGGRSKDDTALLQFMVKGVTIRSSGDVTVKVNNEAVGVIQNAPGADPEHWFTQMIPFAGSVLENGDNTITISANTYTEQSNDDFDDFELYSIVCFFHQDA